MEHTGAGGKVPTAADGVTSREEPSVEPRAKETPNLLNTHPPDLFFFRCINAPCRWEYDAQRRLYQCPKCGDLLEIAYRFPELDPRRLKEQFRERRISNRPLDVSGTWRFREFLPFVREDYGQVVTLGEGNTPVLEAPFSAKYAGLRRLRIKHLGWNPTGSFKDYGMTVAATQAQKLGCRIAVCASTGNTSASMAAYCARSHSLKAVVFIPEGAIAYGKLAQALEYGALTVQIQGDFDAAMKLVRELSEDSALYLMNSVNPFRLEGQKTVMFELLDQLDWTLPDHIVVPGGNLGNSSAFGKGIEELLQVGLIERIPSITIVQAAGAAPLHRMVASGLRELVPVEAATRATAIKIGNPVSWKKALRTLHLSNGRCEAVSEEEIADAKAALARDGIGCEPASATTLAAIRKLVRGESPHIDPTEEVVAILTGHQLKDSEYTVDYHLGRLFADGKPEAREPMPFANRPIRIPAQKSAILEILNEIG